jgi:predicted cupin superfamily sugar epimerase
MHRLPGVEVFHHYAGAPARMLLLHADGSVDQPVLGPDLEARQRPQAIVPGGTWQGCETLGDWSLLGATMAPGYRDADFRVSPAAPLVTGWPSAADRIARLTRS